MDGKGKFNIPSFEEMEDDDGPQIKPSSLFHSYKSSSKTSPVQMDKHASHDVSTTVKTAKETMTLNTATSRTSEGSTNFKSFSSVRRVTSSNSPVNFDESKNHTGQLPKFNLTKVSDVVKKSASEDNEQDGKSSSNHTKKTEALQTKTNETESSKTETQEIVSISPPRPGKNALIVSPKQRGNPILKFIRNVPWEFGDIVPDYVMGKATCALFLSLRYHHLNPNYIHERLKQLGHSYDLRVLLLQVDVKDPHHSLKELCQICMLTDCTLILAFSPDEAGRYLETYKAYESKPADLIMERTEGNYLAQLTDFLTSAKKVNKTDSMTLLSTFGSINNMIKASIDDLSLCPGFGPQKAKRLHDVFHQPFLKKKRKKVTGLPAEGDQPEPSSSKDG